VSITSCLRLASLLAASALLVAACDNTSATTTATTEPASSTVLTTPPAIPAPASAEEAQLQARAMYRFCDPCVSYPICMGYPSTPFIRAAVQEVFPSEVEYTWDAQTILNEETGRYRCLVLSAGVPQVVRDDLIAIPVIHSEHPGGGQGIQYLFRWDGVQWVDTTPEETGVTTTLSIE
jgi:hypothetical protein